mgnify:FL=1
MREILEVDEQPPVSRSLWQWECPNTDYLGIGSLMF